MQKADQDTVIKAIEGGMSPADAMALAGYSRAYFYELQKNDPRFAEELEKARLRNKQRALLIIEQAAIKQWQAAAWLMERKYKNEYALTSKVEVTGAIDVRVRALELLRHDTDDDATQGEGQVLAERSQGEPLQLPAGVERSDNPSSQRRGAKRGRIRDQPPVG